MEKHILDDSTPDAQEKRSAWFEKLSIWNLEGEQKEEVANTIIDDIKTWIEYRSQMWLSSLIAALGLLINATPVVIGAMLIAPIMRPIQGVSFATTSGNKRLFFRSLRILVLSIGLGIALSVVTTWIIPLTNVTNEIAMRTTPTLIDLGIAFASGIVAFLAFGWKKMSNSLAWVAMAASLVPPLSVIGIGIGFMSIHIAWGSFILFMTNLVAIIVAGIGIFYLFGFHPTQKDDMKRSVINLSSAIIMMVVIAIPLASSLMHISKNIVTERVIDDTVNTFFHDIDEKITIEHITFKNENWARNISITAKVPQAQIEILTSEQQEILTKQLAASLRDDIQLDMILIPFTSISEAQATQPSLEDQINLKTTQFLNTLYHETAYLVEFTYIDTPRKIVIANFYADQAFDKTQFQKQYISYLHESFPFIEKVILNRQSEYREELPPTEQQERIKNITNNFTSFFPETQLSKIIIDYFPNKEAKQKSKMIISLWLMTPFSPWQLETNLISRKTQLQELYPETIIELKNYVGYLEEI